MSTVITEQQARKITGGRAPLIPLEYENACAELEKCCTLDEAKYWSDKADALAAWAKIYRDDKAGETARRVKLRAYDRIGCLARDLQPTKHFGGRKGGSSPGPSKLLVEHGFSKDQAAAALAISRAPRDKLRKAVDRAIGVNRARTLFRGNGRPAGRPVSSEAWLWLTDKNGGGPNLHNVRAAMRGKAPLVVARLINPGEMKAARGLVAEITEWLAEFDTALDEKSSASPPTKE